ncbi:DUF4307 domain-containing protein [Aeromicrobium sp. Root236]|uniref:DUF4307 domain-containing protein n=1 Tax=Aeromicrobium sp. Root236 TaxID=1736498 RepID=UPI00138F5CA0|nr:DUF4307 domain-containing protein [Aeromicrobium sp. Root236]
MTDLSSRYGTRTRPRWFWPAIAAIGIAIGVSFAAWVGFQDEPVKGRLWGYDVKSDHLVTLKVDVIRPDPLAVRCTVYAQAADHSIVGEKTVDVAAGKAEKTRITIDVQTERKAVTGVLKTCEPRG